MNHGENTGEGSEFTFEDRKKYPRKTKRLFLDLTPDNSDTIVGDSINLSCNGAYCQVPKHIAAMTKLKVVIELPSEDDEVDNIECNGVVVRAEGNPPNSDLYNLAIYFNEIGEFERQRLENYLAS
jgi:hypothetical protein